MNDIHDLKDRTLTIERTFKAPISLVWQAWTQAEHIAQWWGPPGMETQVIDHDFRVGGRWKYTMQMPNGMDFISEGVYTEIIELQKIVSTANFKPMTEGVELQMLFEDQGANTKFTFHVVHSSAEYCKQQEAMGFYNGWGSTFTRLDDYLSSK